MPKKKPNPEEDRFLGEFAQRVREARERKFETAKEMAIALGIRKPDTYSKYESRTPLPHHLIPRFCLISGISADELYGIKRVRHEEVPSQRASGGSRRPRQAIRGSAR